MNLFQFYNLISSDECFIDPNSKSSEIDLLFGERLTLFNIVNGLFSNRDVSSISIGKNPHQFTINTANENIAKYAEDRLNNQIVTGSYKPFFFIKVNRNLTSLIIELIEV